MKQIVIIGAAMFSIAQLGSAAACGNGMLSSYLALGAGGCTIGNNTVSNFQIIPHGQAGATALSPLNVTIAVSGGNYSPLLTFSTHQVAAGPTLLEALFSYKISGNKYLGSAISLSGSSETGDEAVADTQSFCAGGTFTGPDGVSGCSGPTSGDLVTVDGAPPQTDSQTFAAVPFVTVADDFTLGGGTMGTAHGGTFTDNFTAVPEPVSMLLTAAGLVLAAGFRMRSARAGFERNKD